MPNEEIEKFEENLELRRNRVLNAAAAKIAEHFESVQIICTGFDPQEGTSLYSAGQGNYYARIGATERWLRTEKRK